MQLLRRAPGVAYYSNVLALPKSHFVEEQLRGALTYDLGNDKDPLRAYQEERHHFLVPRNFIAQSAFGQLPFPVVDARLRFFPKVSYRSKVVLDAKNPHLTIQHDGAEALLATYNGVLSLRCGAGKTVTAIDAIQRLRTPALVLVNDRGLAHQWHEAVRAFTDLKNEDIGFIGDGEFTWQRPFVIGTVQTLAGMVRKQTLPREVVEHFGVVLADEAHTTAGPAFFNQAITPFHGRRWALSATPRRGDGFDSLLQYTLGNVVYSYLMPELTPLIYFRMLSTEVDFRNKLTRRACCDVSGQLHLGKLAGYLSTREDRLKIIIAEIRSALDQGRHPLVLSQSRDMLDALAAAFPEAGLVHGGVKSREERFRRIRDCNPVIAIAKLGKEALDKPKLDTLIMCEPYTKAGVLQQCLGRILRDEPDKQQPLAVFYDDVNIDKLHGMCMKIRSIFNRWPDNQGGRLRWQAIGADAIAQGRIRK